MATQKNEGGHINIKKNWLYLVIKNKKGVDMELDFEMLIQMENERIALEEQEEIENKAWCLIFNWCS